MKRADGERVRIEHQLTNLRGLIDGFESSFRGNEVLLAPVQSIVNAATLLVSYASRLDAYRWAESDLLPSVCDHCEDKHVMQVGDRNVPCTRCPTPCPKCAGYNGTGAYCARPRCTCGCHEKQP